MKTELEEAAERLSKDAYEKHSVKDDKLSLDEQIQRSGGFIVGFKEGLVNGVKWQIDKQDNFIIGFLEFIEGTYSYSNIFDYWYLHADTSKTYTKKELLKKYIDTLNGN